MVPLRRASGDRLWLPRVTEDIDVTVDLGDHTARELVVALRVEGFRLRVGDTAGFVEQTRVLPVVHSRQRYRSISSSRGLASRSVPRTAYAHKRGGHSIPVASPEDLIVMKMLAGRPATSRTCGPSCAPSGRSSTCQLDHRDADPARAGPRPSDLLPLFARLRKEAARTTRAQAAKLRRGARPVRPAAKKRRPRS